MAMVGTLQSLNNLILNNIEDKIPDSTSWPRVVQWSFLQDTNYYQFEDIG